MSRKQNRKQAGPHTGGQEIPSHALGVRPDALLPEAFPEGFTLRDEANAIVAWVFRNGPIEDLHAGKYSALLEDSSLSRITDPEMKTLMLNACRKMEELLRLKESGPAKYALQIRSYNHSYCRRWER